MGYAGHELPADRCSTARQARGLSGVSRSFTGALKRLPDRQVAGLVALLELLTFGQALLLAVPGPRAGGQALERFVARWAERTNRLQHEDPLRLRQGLVQSMRLRLHGRRGGFPPPTHLDAFLQELCGAVGHLYGIPEHWPYPQRFQAVLCAAAHEASACATLQTCVQRLARRTAARAASTAGLFVGASALAYIGRHRMALTLTTLVYVLLSSLFGLTLTFEVYRWIALTVEALARPPALLTYLFAGGGLAYARHRRRFDLHMLAMVVASLYRGIPPSGPA